MKKYKILYVLTIIISSVSFSTHAIAADLYLNSPLASDYYQSNDSIIAQGGCEVPAGNWAWLAAGVGVTLQPGFRVESGAEFGVVIGGLSDLPPSLDHDDDGLGDGWEFTYFADLNQTGLGDYDSDSVANYIELEFGTNPADINDNPDPVISYEYDALGRIKKIIRMPSQ